MESGPSNAGDHLVDLANQRADMIENSGSIPRGWQGQSWRAVIIARSSVPGRRQAVDPKLSLSSRSAIDVHRGYVAEANIIGRFVGRMRASCAIF